MAVPITILPERPEDEWYLSQWRELIAGEKPGGADAFSLQSSEATITIWMYGNQVRSALRQILGWAWADSKAPYQLHRESIALQHPRYTTLWANACSVSDRHPLAALQSDATLKAKVAGAAWSGYGPAYYAQYGLAEVTVRFHPVWWRQYPDSDPTWQNLYLGKEWLRNFGPVGKQLTLDVISAEGANDQSSLYFAEGNPDGGPTHGVGPGLGVPFGGTQYVRVPRTTFRLQWRTVPIAYTCGPVSLAQADIASYLLPYPERLVRALGTVNQTNFPGSNSPHAPGTLMLVGVEEVPFQLPVRTDSEFGLLAADYTLIFEQFDPPRDPDCLQYKTGGVVTGVLPHKRGHLLFPYRPAGRYWYYASSGGEGTRGTVDGGNPAIESTEFHDIFRHRNDPDYPIPA